MSFYFKKAQPFIMCCFFCHRRRTLSELELVVGVTCAPCEIGLGSQGVIAAKVKVASEVDACDLRYAAVGQEEHIRAELHRLSKAMRFVGKRGASFQIKDDSNKMSPIPFLP